MKIFIAMVFLTLFLGADQIELIKPSRAKIVDTNRCNPKKCVKVKIDVDLTNIEWLDTIVLEYVLGQNTLLLNNKEKIDYIKLLSQKIVDTVLEEPQEFDVNYESIDSEVFLYQRYNLATFKGYHYSYTGGAHGTHGVFYNIVDMQNKKVLTLDDIVSTSNRKKLAQKLLDVYKMEHEEYVDTFLPKTLGEQLEHMLVDNFYLKEHSIVFVYNPYHIGPYSDGVMEIELFYDELKDICLPKYI